MTLGALICVVIVSSGCGRDDIRPEPHHRGPASVETGAAPSPLPAARTTPAPAAVDGQIAGFFPRRGGTCPTPFEAEAELCVHSAIASDPRASEALGAYRRGSAPPRVNVADSSVIWPGPRTRNLVLPMFEEPPTEATEPERTTLTAIPSQERAEETTTPDYAREARRLRQERLASDERARARRDSERERLTREANETAERRRVESERRAAAREQRLRFY